MVVSHSHRASEATMPTTESPVRRMMRRLAHEPTERNRFALYTALLNARLLVPLLPGHEAIDELPTTESLARGPDVAQASSGQPTFVVFCDDVDLVRWRPGGGPRTHVLGTLLFPLLAESGCTSLHINPKSRVGGMLYGHEVTTIAEAATRRYGQS